MYGQICGHEPCTQCGWAQDNHWHKTCTSSHVVLCPPCLTQATPERKPLLSKNVRHNGQGVVCQLLIRRLWVVGPNMLFYANIARSCKVFEMCFVDYFLFSQISIIAPIGISISDMLGTTTFLCAYVHLFATIPHSWCPLVHQPIQVGHTNCRGLWTHLVPCLRVVYTI